MRRFLFFIFVWPFSSLGQSANFPTKVDLAKIYSQAISDFITDARKRTKSNFDTLYFGKRNNGQPDDFPDIELPATIEKTHIRLISPEAGTIKQQELKSRIYINMAGWVDKEKAEFLFFVFSNGFDHQFNYTINYRFNAKLKEFELVNLQFKGPPFEK